MIFVPYTELDYEIANSYLNVADATDIISKQTNGTAWATLPNETKEMLLMQSSLAVDGALSYKGVKTSATQLLKFPRDGLYTLPRNIIFAVAMTALKYSNDDIFKGISREKIAKHETEYFEGKEIAQDVLAFLKPLRANTIKVEFGNSNE